MTIWGINIIDLLIVLVFLIILIWIGARTKRDNNSTQDFFLAGRKLNKMYQFFLNFGCSTHADQTVAVTREIYRQGIGGMWIQFLVLFLTPFYWFTTFFFRRVRLVTIGDFFAERFRSKFLGAAHFIVADALGAHLRRQSVDGLVGFLSDGFLHLHLENQVRAALQVQPQLDLPREIVLDLREGRREGRQAKNEKDTDQNDTEDENSFPLQIRIHG